MKPQNVVLLAAGAAAFGALTRVVPIKVLHPLFLQNPQWKAFAVCAVVAAVLAVVGAAMASDSSQSRA